MVCAQCHVTYDIVKDQEMKSVGIYFPWQGLMKAGVEVPVKVDLELKKYLENRGEKKLQFNPKMEIKDPFRVQDMF
ncbi:MAG: ammonia-forming cytochrome c nitrite reductase subunit c552 [Nitrospirota bacterium]